MSFETRVFICAEIDPWEVFRACRRLLGTPDEHGSSQQEWLGECRLMNDIGGQPARLIVFFRRDEPLVSAEEAAACDLDCEASCNGEHPHRPPCWLKVTFDTTLGYTDELGRSAAGLHAALVADLGRWLDERGLPWGWRDVDAQRTHLENQYERLFDLNRPGRERRILLDLADEVEKHMLRRLSPED